MVWVVLAEFLFHVVEFHEEVDAAVLLEFGFLKGWGLGFLLVNFFWVLLNVSGLIICNVLVPLLGCWGRNCP